MSKMQRRSVAPLFKKQGENPALLFSRGYAEWPQNATERGKAQAAFLGRVAEQTVPVAYRHVFDRWCDLGVEADGFSHWIGKIDGRLFMGLGGAQVLETNLTMNRPYGVPMIPGTSLKGLARAHARVSGLDENSAKVLFGYGGESPDTDESGYLIFHDAWWIPGSAETPFAQEVVTVHHPDYYGKKGREPATDFDSPNPNAQLAVRGSFLFLVEGVQVWADLGMKILHNALAVRGVGAKVSAGYGYFREDLESAERLVLEAEKREQERVNRQKSIEMASLPPEQRLRRQVEEFDDQQLSVMLSKNWNKTKQEYGDTLEALMKLIRELHGATIESWKGSPRGNEKKAHRNFRRYFNG